MVDLPFRFHHISKFQFHLLIDRFHGLVESVEEGYPRWNGNSLDILIADVVNLFNQGSDGVRMRDYQTFVTSLHGWHNDIVVKWHNVLGRIFE